MTLLIGLAVRDALVFAADSRMMAGQRISSDSVDKIFPINEHLVVAMAGAAYVGTVPIRDIILAAASQVPRGTKAAVEHIQKSLLENQTSIGPDFAYSLMIGGYDENGEGHLYRLFMPSGDVVHDGSTLNTNIALLGQSTAILRLLDGVDPHLRFSMFQSLPRPEPRPTSAEPESEVAAAALPAEAAVAVAQPSPIETLQNMLRPYSWFLGLSFYTVQDAIDLCDFLMNVTTGAQRFVALSGSQPMPQNVGGPIDILVMTRSGIRWHRKKETYMP